MPDDWDDDDEFHPLWVALSVDRDFETAERLIREGAKLDELIDEDGGSPLHHAASDGDAETVEFYLSHESPRSRESFDICDHTPLIAAAIAGRTEIVVRLLSARVDVNANNEPKIGNTAIREAVRHGHVDIVRLLLAAGADPTIPGWMQLSAVDQAWDKIEGSERAAAEIRTLLADYPRPKWVDSRGR